MKYLKGYCKALLSEIWYFVSGGLLVTAWNTFLFLIKSNPNIKIPEIWEQAVTITIISLTLLIAPYKAWKKLQEELDAKGGEKEQLDRAGHLKQLKEYVSTATFSRNSGLHIENNDYREDLKNHEHFRDLITQHDLFMKISKEYEEALKNFYDILHAILIGATHIHPHSIDLKMSALKNFFECTSEPKGHIPVHSKVGLYEFKDIPKTQNKKTATFLHSDIIIVCDCIINTNVSNIAEKVLNDELSGEEAKKILSLSLKLNEIEEEANKIILHCRGLGHLSGDCKYIK